MLFVVIAGSPPSLRVGMTMLNRPADIAGRWRYCATRELLPDVDQPRRIVARPAGCEPADYASAVAS
jgi:hypothetical protein